MHGKKTSRYSNSFLHLMGFLAELCTKSLFRPAFLFVEYHGKCFSLVGTFRSGISAERKGEYGKYMGMSRRGRRDSWNFDNVRVEVACFAAATTIFLSQLFRSKKRNLRPPYRILRARISSTLCLALKIQRHPTTSMYSLTRELYACELKVSRQTKNIRVI